jgi:hypothetical protein
MTKALRTRMVQAAKERFAELGEQDRARQMFPSTLPGDRGCCSPLGGQAKPAPNAPQPKGPKSTKLVW